MSHPGGDIPTVTHDQKGVVQTTLVNGGAGFPGSHLCDRLIGAGHSVICMDNLLTGNFQNLRHLLTHPHFTFVRHDVTRAIGLAGLLGQQSRKFRASGDESVRIDNVAHLASPASPKANARRPLQTLKIAAVGTCHALGLAKAHKSVFLITSTSEIYGDDSQTRSFCYVSDLIEGLYRLLLSEEVGSINLGNPEEVQLLDLARTIVEITKSRSLLVFEPLPPGDPARRRPDISRAESSLKWHPKIDLRVDIRRVLPYFRSQLIDCLPHQGGHWTQPAFLTHDNQLLQNN